MTTNLPEDVERAVNSSITITATEHMKEKKKKGEVAIPLGSISIDPLPLFLGKSTIQNMYQLSHPSHLNFPKPIEFDVAITIPHPLLTRQQAQDLNILTCTVSGYPQYNIRHFPFDLWLLQALEGIHLVKLIKEKACFRILIYFQWFSFLQKLRPHVYVCYALHRLAS